MIWHHQKKIPIKQQVKLMTLMHNLLSSGFNLSEMIHFLERLKLVDQTFVTTMRTMMHSQIYGICGVHISEGYVFISTDYWTGGQSGTAVSEHNWNQYYSVNKPAYIEVWRLTGSCPQPTPSKNDTKAIKEFKEASNKYTAYEPFKVDAIKYHNNIWQFVNYTLSGGSDVDWDDNGIPLSCVDNITRGNDKDTQIGDTVKFMKPFNKGIISEYDNATNGIGIDTGGYGRIWYNADAFLKI